MGLLDFNPNLQMGMGLLAAGGPSRMPVSFGQGLASAYGQAQEAQSQNSAMQQRREMFDLQKQQHQFALSQQQKAMLEQETAKQNLQQYVQSLPDGDPKKAQITQALQMGVPMKEVWDKLNPKQEDYTLTPGAQRFGPNNQPLASVPVKPDPLPWYVQKNENGTQIDPAYAAFEKMKAANMRPPAQPMAPVAYVDPATGQTVWGTITDARGKPAANYNPFVQGQVAGAKEVGKGAGEFNMKQYQAAESAVPVVQKINQQLALIEKGDITTGFAAELRNDVNRAVALVGPKALAGKVSDTEVLESMMGSDVFGMISALGIGARGLDTPAEREFMRQVLTGTKSLNKETLKRMAETRRNVAQRAIDKFNNRVDSGELDNFFRASGLPNKRIESGATQGDLQSAAAAELARRRGRK